MPPKTETNPTPTQGSGAEPQKTTETQGPAGGSENAVNELTATRESEAVKPQPIEGGTPIDVNNTPGWPIPQLGANSVGGNNVGGRGVEAPIPDEVADKQQNG